MESAFGRNPSLKIYFTANRININPAWLYGVGLGLADASGVPVGATVGFAVTSGS